MAKAKDDGQPIYREIGCKVEWRWYRTLKSAKKAAAEARKEAITQAARGYDFGYQTPGSISKTERGYCVVFP